ncbi:MAG: PLP-dependent lyase/thiolase [bacterium]|nr:PLP-dependent lyase/thiolase [bacterium]
MFFTRNKVAESRLDEKEEAILRSIVIASENNPHRPEFPPGNPKFPATPTYKIDVPGFTNVWLKDESVNPTGTHKDRLAWEIVVTYRYFLESKRDGQTTGELPQMSIISSGNAAVAIQAMLRHYGLPNLKVLVDSSLAVEKIDAMTLLGCEIFKTDLSKEVLGWSDILELTSNLNGFDITSSEALDPTTRFYDWLSYEIININPDFCFVPFGTGNLYENILNINKKEVISDTHDPRFKGNPDILRRCNFLGATTNDPRSKIADFLYSPHLPFAHYNEQWIRLYRQAGYCGTLSDVHIVNEQYVDEALALAQKQNITCEPSAISGLALLLQLRDSLPKDKKMLVVNTGKAHLPNNRSF